MGTAKRLNTLGEPPPAHATVGAQSLGNG